MDNKLALVNDLVESETISMITTYFTECIQDLNSILSLINSQQYTFYQWMKVRTGKSLRNRRRLGKDLMELENRLRLVDTAVRHFRKFLVENMKPDSTGQRYGSTRSRKAVTKLENKLTAASFNTAATKNLCLNTTNNCGWRLTETVRLGKTDKQENTKENSTAITSDALVAQKYYDKKASTEIEHAEATELECIGQMKLTADGDGTKTGICSQTVGELYGLSLSDKQDQVPEPMDSDSSMPSENSSVACKPSDEDNYDIADLSSEDTTDSEDSPKKKIPTWASFRCLDRELRKQSLLPLSYVDKIFGEVEAPDLNVIFSGDRIYCTKRTSSAVWASPLSNPRQGISIYDSVQKQS